MKLFPLLSLADAFFLPMNQPASHRQVVTAQQKPRKPIIVKPPARKPQIIKQISSNVEKSASFVKHFFQANRQRNYVPTKWDDDDYRQFSNREYMDSCLMPRYNECPDFQECLVEELNMKKGLTFKKLGNQFGAKYEVKCQDGYYPNMEGRESTMVECGKSPRKLGMIQWNFKNSFDCIPIDDGSRQRTSFRTAPACNPNGIQWFTTENYVRKDNTPTATWNLLLDNKGAFVRTRIPMDLLTDSTGYDTDGFIMLVVYNLKLSDFQNAGENIEFVSYSGDMKYISHIEDAESTIVAFRSTNGTPSLASSLNVYWSINGVNMTQDQHQAYNVGTIAGTGYTYDWYISALAECILPLIDGTPSVP